MSAAGKKVGLWVKEEGGGKRGYRGGGVRKGGRGEGTVGSVRQVRGGYGGWSWNKEGGVG